MQEKFEENIEQQLSSFSLQPSPLVWQEVEAALHPKGKRRLLIWWWLPLLGLIVGGLWLMQTNEKNSSKKQETPGQEVKGQVGKEREVGGQALKSQSLNEQVNKRQKIALQENKNPQNKLKENHSTIITLSLSKQQKNQNNFTDFINNDRQTQTNKIDKEVAINIPINSSTEINITPKNIDVTAIITELKDTVNKTQDSSKAIVKIAADTALQKKVISKPIIKKQSWFLMFGGGFLNTPFNNTNYGALAASGALSSSSVPPNLVANREALPQPTNCINLKIGLQYVTDLSKHWQLETGLQYVYLQNQLMLKNDTAVIFSNSYIAGNNFTLTNKAHLLQVSLTLGFSFNADSKNRFSILLGGSLSWAFSQQWLIADNTNKRLYYNPSLNNKLFLGVHGGMVFNQNNRFKIALVTDYSVTPIHKNTADNYHFLQYSLQLSKPLNFKHKSSSKK